MAEYTSGQIHFSGLGSGTDFDTMITKLMDVEASHAKQLMSWKEDWETKISAFQELNTNILTLQKKISKISTMSNFLVKTATVNSPYGNNVVSVRVGEGAEVGSRKIEVKQLAQNAIYMNNSGFATKDKSMGLSGSFIYTYTEPGEDPVTRTLNVTSSTTLEGLCNQINSDPENPGVKASIVRNGDSYYMQLRGMDQGAEANLVIGEGTMPGFNAAGFTHMQANQDAKFKVDGWPPATTTPASAARYRWTTPSTDSTAAIGTTGTFEFSYTEPGNTPVNVSINIDPTDSMEDVRDKINSSTSGVQASISEENGFFYLDIEGAYTGAEANIVIGNGTAAGFDAAGFHQEQANADASESEGWLTASTNTINEVIPGLTMTLTGTGESWITTSVDRDKVEENINEFVEMVNELRTLLKDLTEVTTTSSGQMQGSTLTGNYGVQLIGTRINNAVTNSPPGFAPAKSDLGEGDLYSALSQLGIRTDTVQSSSTNGLLIFDQKFFGDTEDQLKKALDKDIEAVAALFAADGVGSQMVTSGNFSYYHKIDTITKPGTYDVTYDIDASGNIINAKIGGKKANVNNEDKTITSVAGDSSGLIIKVNDVTPNTSGKGVAQIKQGIIGCLNDVLLDVTKDGLEEEDRGALKILEGRYKDIVANIDKKIEKEQNRLVRKERDMRARFSRLEALLGTYDQKSQQLSSQIAQLQGSTS